MFDWLSLLVCMSSLTESVVEYIPIVPAASRQAITFSPLAERTFTLTPWPFNVPEFDLVVEMHHLTQPTFENEAHFHRAWQQSEIDHVVFQVVSG